MDSSKPTIMCFSGLDSTGGAGIQADIETLFSLGCHCAPVITSLSVQNTQDVISQEAVDSTLIVQQARAILEDMPVHAFKIGLLGSIGNVEVLHTLFSDYSSIPVILDPILAAGGGFSFGEQELVDALRSLLIPVSTILTPNSNEIKLLAPSADTVDACANELIDLGCQNILLTGTHANTPAVINTLYSTHADLIHFDWPRLEGSYHGSGCTLTSAIAAYLAHGSDIHEAVQQAQRFTWESLSHGSRLGLGQLIPNRSFWNHQPH